MKNVSSPWLAKNSKILTPTLPWPPSAGRLLLPHVTDQIVELALELDDIGAHSDALGAGVVVARVGGGELWARRALEHLLRRQVPLAQKSRAGAARREQPA